MRAFADKSLWEVLNLFYSSKSTSNYPSFLFFFPLRGPTGLRLQYYCNFYGKVTESVSDLTHLPTNETTAAASLLVLLPSLSPLPFINLRRSTLPSSPPPNPDRPQSRGQQPVRERDYLRRSDLRLADFHRHSENKSGRCFVEFEFEHRITQPTLATPEIVVPY